MPRLVGPVIGLIVLALVVAFAVRRWVRQWRASRARPRMTVVPPRDPGELRTLFEDGRRFGDAQIRVERIASLHLASGRIVACDPLVFPDDPPFARGVAAGDYPVDVAVARLPDQQRVAAVRVTFASGTPARFEDAGRYGVDAGVGCFMDHEAARLLDGAMSQLPDGETYYDGVLAAELADRDWVDHRPVRDRRDNVVIVHSGWGDGLYTSYWALDENDAPLWLVTDFRVV